MRGLLRLLPLLLLLIETDGCAGRTASGTAPATSGAERRGAVDVFDAYLNAGVAPADGFDFPFGNPDGKGSYTDKATGRSYNGWYVATHFAEKYSMGIHTGEDWNGTGGGNTDLGQDVFAVANGRVVFAGDCGRLWGNVIVIEHAFYENFERRRVRSLYAHLQTTKVRRGEEVKRRQLIATVGQDPEKLFNAHLHLELRRDESLAPTYWPSSDGKDQAWVREHYAEPSAFINSHRRLPVPQQEATLVLVDQNSYRMRLYERGRMQGEYDVSFGQSKGQKRLQGDNRTPKGMYFVTYKHRGKFDGAYGGYYGGHWIKVNYPNKFDAAWGRTQGIITPQQEAQINAAWERRAPTLETAGLGGGIGFHGWIREWSNDGPRHLSWGCVVMHLSDIGKVFDQIPEGTMVVIF
ncbi:MAG TPA: peptidoglycan DD-metalloendopeptidase family protein [Blastocatellia bacterium]|nr:peptidoglycan DD-metalloendopeptidase family protein [Blastocatellia bacterium]